jgi:hypothetical protein
MIPLVGMKSIDYGSLSHPPPSPHHLDSFEETTDEEFNKTQLEAYNLEKMDPKYRWEQEQINALEGFAILEKLALVQAEIEQSNQIDAVQRLELEEQQGTNNEELIRFQQ